MTPNHRLLHSFIFFFLNLANQAENIYLFNTRKIRKHRKENEGMFQKLSFTICGSYLSNSRRTSRELIKRLKKKGGMFYNTILYIEFSLEDMVFLPLDLNLCSKAQPGYTITICHFGIVLINLSNQYLQRYEVSNTKLLSFSSLVNANKKLTLNVIVGVKGFPHLYYQVNTFP